MKSHRLNGHFPPPDVDPLHVVPVYPGEPEHEASIDCWCEPELEYRDEITGGEVWSHRRPH
jgi:hypothetical protein